MANLEQLRDAVRIRLGVPAADAFYSDPTVDNLINEALNAVATEVDWPWLEATETISTVAGTAAYTPAANWTRTKALTINQYDSLLLRSLQEIREIDSTVQGLPLYYCVAAEQIILRPVPDAVYAIIHDYYKIEPALVTNTDTPLMPAPYHSAIVEYAVYLAALRSGEQARMQAAQQGYANWLRRILDNRRRSRSTMRVRVRPGSLL